MIEVDHEQLPLCISHYFDGRPLYGWINELKIWNIARNENEIKQYMYKYNITLNEINNKINSYNLKNNEKKIILRKYFTMTEDMQWIQKIQDKYQSNLDHLLQYS